MATVVDNRPIPPPPAGKETPLEALPGAEKEAEKKKCTAFALQRYTRKPRPKKGSFNLCNHGFY